MKSTDRRTLRRLRLSLRKPSRLQIPPDPRRHRQAAEQASRRYHSLLHQTTDAVFLIDPASGQPLEINPQAERILGYGSGELSGLKLEELFTEKEKRRYLRLLSRTRRQGEGKEYNLQIRRKDGRKRTLHVNARRLELGSRSAILGVLRDVTGARQTEKKLRQKNLNLQLLNQIVHQVSGEPELSPMLQGILEAVLDTFEADGGGIYLRDPGSHQLDLAARKGISGTLARSIRTLAPGKGLVGRTAATGHPRFASELRHDPRLLHPEVLLEGWRSFQAVPLLSRGHSLGVLFFFYRGERILAREEMQLLLNIGRQAGAAVERAELFETVRRQHHLSESAHRELARIEKMKSSFLAMASHELRTPTTCVLAGAQLLEEKLGAEAPPEFKDILNVILQGGERLEQITGELLEVARIESASLELDLEPVDLPELFGEIGEELQPALRQRNLQLSTDPAPRAPDLRADRRQLKRTLERLLENAIKATRDGGEIHLAAALLTAAELEPDKPSLELFRPDFARLNAHRRLLRIDVRDTGIGIAPDERLRIFDKFYEIGDFIHHSSSRTAFGGKGVGLGLALVRGLVEAHEGAVWVQDPPDDRGGSLFSILLPLGVC